MKRQRQPDRLKELEILNQELEAILEASFDEIFVTDGQGKTLRVNKACERLYGIPADQLIGCSVHELQDKGFFNPSAALKSIQLKERVTIVQETKEGGRLVVTANPVINEDGEISRVICTAKDVTELARIQRQLFAAEEKVKKYKKELQILKDLESHAPVTQNERMIELISNAKRMAKSDAPIMIQGESGVGKEVMVQYIHQCSNRSHQPFVKVNCGAIPDSLVEAELFGYEKGAFTGAESTGKKGVFQEAEGGTLFLDEVGELPYPSQAKLLQVLQDGTFKKVGGTQTYQVNVRVIAATNRDLSVSIQEKKFREDLFYRLNVFSLTIPPLRERLNDIPILSEYFLQRFRIKYDMDKRLSPESLEYMKDYSWPGNVRELRNTLERLVVMTDHEVIEPEDLSLLLKKPVAQHSVSASENKKESPLYINSLLPLKTAVDMVEKQLLLMAQQSSTSTYYMAELLDVNQSTIVRKMKKHQIN